MLILGINAYHGDVSAVLVRDGELVAAVEEERFRRVKHYAGFPRDAIRACLAMAGVAAARRRLRRRVARSRKRTSGGKRCSRCATGRARRWSATARRNALSVRRHCTRLSPRRWILTTPHVAARMHYVEHHAAHLASSFFVSPVRRRCRLRDRWLRRFRQHVVWRRPRTEHRRSRIACSSRTRSGCCISRSRSILGFPKYGDEFKVMGLAPYGEPDFVARDARSWCPLERRTSSSSTSAYFTPLDRAAWP